MNAPELAVAIYRARFGQTPAPQSSWMKEIVPLLAEALWPITHIHALMDGTEWSADTLDEIAAILREYGLVIREPQ